LELTLFAAFARGNGAKKLPNNTLDKYFRLDVTDCSSASALFKGNIQHILAGFKLRNINRQHPNSISCHFLGLIKDSFLTKIENMKSVVLPVDGWGRTALLTQ
jgi:hypothetical protein